MRRRCEPVGLREGAVALQAPPPAREISRRVEQHALGRQTVAAGTPRLLQVLLERARRAGVDDEAHVGAVDAHAEGDGRHHHFDPLGEERLLDARALVVGQAGVVGERPHAPLGQPRGELLDLAPRRAVDDAAVARVARDDLEHLTRRLVPPHDAVDEVRAGRTSRPAPAGRRAAAARRCRRARARWRWPCRRGRRPRGARRAGSRAAGTRGGSRAPTR